MAPRYCRASTFGNDQASYKGLTIVNGMGKQTGMSDGSGQTAWSYNAIGSVLTERRTILGMLTVGRRFAETISWCPGVPLRSSS
jgi:hypothetical protein